MIGICKTGVLFYQPLLEPAVVTAVDFAIEVVEQPVVDVVAVADDVVVDVLAAAPIELEVNDPEAIVIADGDIDLEGEC